MSVNNFMSDTESAEYTDYTDSNPTGDKDEAAAPTADGENPDGQAKRSEEEEEEKGEPEPEPEPDPLEGLVYEDDPEATLPPYGDVEYWERRYTDDTEVMDWYQDPQALLEYLQKYVQPDGRALIIGTGNSNLPPFMAQNGFESVTAIDFARPCIAKSKRRNRETEGITWRTMDVRKMTFPDGNFQAVIDKGCLDCLFFAGETDVLAALTEIARILKGRGVYLCISYAPPDSRRQFLHRPADLRLQLEEPVIELKKLLPSEQPHYLYVVRKVGKLIS
jgi:ubiquinone/menaquinone biosynthesis C-methylase UbiE